MNLDFFFDPDRPVGLILNAVIVLGALWGAARVVWALVALRRDASETTRLRAAQIRSEDGAGEFAETLAAGSILRQRIAFLRALKERNRPVDAVGLAERTATEVSERIGTPALLRSVLVLLGLAGTLWGLSKAVYDLSAFLQSPVASVEEMKEAILGTLSGMQTAFSTTLAGVFGAVLLSVAIRIYEAREVRFLRALEGATSALLLPLYDTSEAGVIDVASQRLHVLTNSMEQRLDRLTDRLDKRASELSQQIGEAAEDFVIAFGERSQSLLEEIGHIRDRTLRLFGDVGADQPSLATVLGQFTGAVHGLNEATVEAAQIVPNITTAVQATILEQRDALQSVLTSESLELKQLVQHHQDWGRQLTEAATRIADGERMLAESARQMAGASNQYNATWLRIAEAMEGAERETVGLVAELREEIEKTLGATTSAHTEIHDVLRGMVGELSQAVREVQRNLAAEPTRANRQSAELLQTLEDVVGRTLPALAKSVADAGNEGARGIIEEIRLLQREVRQISGGAAHTAIGSSFHGDGTGETGDPGQRMREPDLRDLLDREFRGAGPAGNA